MKYAILAIYLFGAIAFRDIGLMCAPSPMVPPGYIPVLIFVAPPVSLVMWPAVAIGGCNRTFEE